MVRKLLCSASFAGLLLTGIAVHARPTQEQSQQPKQHEQTKTAQGKVTDIASDKKSFTIEVNDNGTKHTMQFVLDGNTQVQGRVSVGTEATVEFQPTPDGKNLAVTITPRTTQQSPAPGK
jgi:membrane-bound inhibitor of C-type lysozyme